jgi:hypothetical protein
MNRPPHWLAFAELLTVQRSLIFEDFEVEVVEARPLSATERALVQAWGRQ